MPLSLVQLRTILMVAFATFPDTRRGKNTQYTMSDVASAAFSVFFMQSPSFLAYQRDMQRKKGRNNAHSLFAVERIPSDSQIRNLLDPVAPDHVREPFWAFLSLLSQADVLTEYFDKVTFRVNEPCGSCGSSAIVYD